MLAPPPFRFRLGKAVGPEQPNAPGDVAAIQEALDSFAQYHLRNGVAGRRDSALDSAVRSVQQRFGLEPDGIARPGGPTEYLLNAILAGGAIALAPDRARTPDRPTFRQQLFLKGPVGARGQNNQDDIEVVRHGLALLGHLPLGAIVPGNDLKRERLYSAIDSHNRRHGLLDGETLRPGSRAADSLRQALDRTYSEKLPEEAPARAGTPLSPGRAAEGKPRGAGDKRPDAAPPQLADRESPAWLKHQAEILGTDLPPDRADKVPLTVATMSSYEAGQGTPLPPKQDLLDVLRFYYEEYLLPARGMPIPAELKIAIEKIYSSIDIDPAFAKAQRPLQNRTFAALVADSQLAAGLDNWRSLNDDQRRELLQRTTKIFSEGMGLPVIPQVRFGSLPGQDTFAIFQPETSAGGFGYILFDPRHLDASSGLTLLIDFVHELGHAYQQKLLTCSPFCPRL